MKTIKNIFCILFFITMSHVIVAQSRITVDTTVFNSAKDSTVFYIDWSQITPEIKVTFINIMSDIARRNGFYKTVTIRADENISRLIKDNYDVVAEKNNHSYQALVSVIHNLNGLDAQNTLVVGTQIRLPRLPITRSRNSTKAFTQFFDPYISQAYILSTDSAAKSNLTTAEQNIQFSNGGLYAYKLSPADLALVKSKLSKKLYRQLYGQALITLDSVHISMVRFPDHQGTPTDLKIPPAAVDSSVARLLATLDKKNFGTYYVFDNFNARSTHGKKVLDVINARFAAYGLDTSGLSIRAVPINYFDNLAFGKTVIENYFASSGTGSKNLSDVELSNEANLLKNVDTSLYAYALCENCIPEVYLHALFGYYYRDKPDVISSSFWSNMELKGIMPRLYKNPPTSLVTAALNESGEIEDKIKNVLVDKGLLVGEIQPINDYFNTYTDNGAMIIGNRLNKGVFVGSHGRHITTAGLGVGWSGRTILPTDTGTSFATPDVATKIYIAKAYWRSKQAEPVTASETRLRVLLGTDIDSGLIGKFESGGTVNMLKLLQTENYAELISGEIVPITNLKLSNAGISASKFDGMPFGRKTIQDGETREGLCGLACVDGRFFKISESVPWWQPAKFKEISISFSTPAGPVVIQSIEDFKSNFKQLIILKNP
ncbi:hypothetical protein [Mucilaginibacter aquariorum]|uniref:Uncharacterized protein n=1 Tax=Mucilaginibacter aquariorum TaxID=2967225 RepID=A0ABT1T100_9SPHI|nr:hypothetical protein [Mucilaginibacter aquariorum]MCQ6958285.1 hypothetical protein [Mucilaginibacter aquariorum]